MSASHFAWRPTPLIRASLGLHAMALGALLVSPGRWPWALAVLVANHLLFTALGMWPRSRLLGANWTRLPAAASARSEVALTIDDGPDPVVTPQVLEILAQHDVAATFFCIGERAARFPELVREIVQRGHRIENHTQHHAWSFAFMGIGGLTRELQEAQSTLASIAGRTPQFFRAPAGLRSPLLDPVLARVGLRLASWTRRGFDTRERDPALATRRLLRDLHAGDILLLHDGNAARTAAGVPVIVAVLPEVLAAIRHAGLHPVTLAEALR